MSATVLTKLASLVASVLGRPRTGSPAQAATSPALDEINQGFHTLYDAARDQKREDGPVFVVLADDLVVFQRGERKAFSFSPRPYHVIKSIAHAPVALYAMSMRSPWPVGQATKLRARLSAAYEKLPEDARELSPGARSDLTRVAQASLALIDLCQSQGFSRQGLADFAATTGPLVLRLADEATRFQLHALHDHTELAVASLSAAERASLQVVVAGDHQARVRSLAMQYFMKRLPERAGAPGRVIYAEGVSDEERALQLVGTQRVDRVLARAFFGDEQRLQRDILGDAAEQQLRDFTSAPIA